jgi:hypothetical protein
MQWHHVPHISLSKGFGFIQVQIGAVRIVKPQFPASRDTHATVFLRIWACHDVNLVPEPEAEKLKCRISFASVNVAL